MGQLRNSIIRAGMGALYFSGVHTMLKPVCAGVGMIFMLHHVRPARVAGFQPNRHLEITPEFLRKTLAHVRAEGIDIVSLDEFHHRLLAGDTSRRFACFTFDDGYRDNRDFALPVMRECDAPFTVYATTDFAAGRGRLWWIALEELLTQQSSIDVDFGGEAQRLACATVAEKQAAFGLLHDRLRQVPGPLAAATAVSALCRRHGIDDEAISARLCLSFDELRSFASDPLVTIGAHTLTHGNLAKAEPATARLEMGRSREILEAELDTPVMHFAYPYGDRDAAGPREFVLAADLGFKTAVTTRPGMIFSENVAHPHALPRLSLNGHYQDERMLHVLTSGTATAMWNGFRRVDAA